MPRNEPKNSGKVNQKNKYPNKESPQWSEENSHEILIHKELVHEDQDPIYPLDSGKDERSKEQRPGNQGFWKSHGKNKEKKGKAD